MADDGERTFEDTCRALFHEIKDALRHIDKEQDPEEADRKLKELGGKFTELIREFEKQARADGLDAASITKRKTAVVVELNKYVAMRKKKQEAAREKEELLQKKSEQEAAKAAAKEGKGKGAKGKGKAADEGEGSKKPAGQGQDIFDTMSTQQLINHGRKTIADTDRSLSVVNDTIAVGQQTTKALQEQGMQLEKIGNDLDEITFSMKKATKILKDMTKQMATDKCILGFLLLIVCGIVTIIILKALHVKLVKNINISVPLPTSSPPPAPTPSAPAGRRLLARRLLAGTGAELGSVGGAGAWGALGGLPAGWGGGVPMRLG